MRSRSSWWVGAGALVALTLACVPSGAALAIDGAVSWRDSAEVQGILHADPSGSMILSQSLPRGLDGGDYAWTMTADRLLLNVVEKHEEGKLVGRMDASFAARPGVVWKNDTFEFRDARIVAELTPTRDFGAAAILRTAEGGRTTAAVLLPEGRPALVRSVEPTIDLMTVPASTTPGSSGHSYSYRAPGGHMLEVVAEASTQVGGDVSGALFGWRLTVSTADQDALVVKTGVEKGRDATTGLPSGNVLRYVTFTTNGAAIALPPLAGDAKLYTPVLRYEGRAAYPAGTYQGRHDDAAPQAQGRMPLDGAIVLSALDDGRYDQSHAHAWGEADWAAAQALPAAAVPAPADPLPMFVAAGGLFLGAQLTPSFGRGLRMGGFLLYARLREQNVRANATRERIFDAIRAEPGQNLSQIVQALEVGWGTAAYHVQILKRQGRVKELRFLNRVCFFATVFAPEGNDEGKQVATVLMRQPNYREIMKVLQSSPGLSQREVAAQTGHARQYISRLVAMMESAGLVRAEASRSGRKYFPHAGPTMPDGTFASPSSPMPSAPEAPPLLDVGPNQF